MLTQGKGLTPAGQIVHNKISRDADMTKRHSHSVQHRGCEPSQACSTGAESYTPDMPDNTAFVGIQFDALLQMQLCQSASEFEGTGRLRPQAVYETRLHRPSDPAPQVH
jgi:hypothetical protein